MNMFAVVVQAAQVDYNLMPCHPICNDQDASYIIRSIYSTENGLFVHAAWLS
jgi:hypothetical protein